MLYIKYISIFFFGLLGCTPGVEKNDSEVFTNPLFKRGQDPWITLIDTNYYYCFSANGSIFIQKSDKITTLNISDTISQWKPPMGTNYSKELWAPELHKIGDKWYIYVAADDGHNKNHRMHVLVSKSKNVEGGFEYVGQLKDPDNHWAIDGTIFQYRQKLYFIWSGWEGSDNVAQNLYIAPMKSPTEIDGKRVLISSPEYDWEKRGSGNGLPTINEGPQILNKNKSYYIVYSASGSWSDNYCLGMLILVGEDPLDPKSWVKVKEPVFEGTESVISPGHCSFTKIGNQDWIVYHVTGSKGGGWKSRYVKMQPFYWVNNIPQFGKPVEDGVPLNLSE